LDPSSIHHIDFETLVLINKRVVSLTGEEHSYEQEDERRARSLLEHVEDLKAASRRDEVLQKASLLIFGLASGQYFHEGNKRTALVAGLAFLELNGLTMDIKDPALVSVVDRAGISTATLNEVLEIIKRLIRDV
jgi:death-on-curing family protein